VGTDLGGVPKPWDEFPDRKGGEKGGRIGNFSGKEWGQGEKIEKNSQKKKRGREIDKFKK